MPKANAFPSTQAKLILIARIKYERDRRGLSTKQLAAKCGMKIGTLYARLRMPGRFTFEELFYLARVFDMTPQELMGGLYFESQQEQSV